jgi:hypothetical protein
MDNLNQDSKSKKHSRVGQVRRMNNGDYATIVVYNNANDISVEINGTLIEHTKYQHFMNGNIKAHVVNFNSHIGECIRMHNGQYASIIETRGYYDIDIKFDDGTIVTTTYPSFKNGETRNPNRNSYIRRQEQKKNFKENRENEVRVMNNGEVATITRYRSATDMDVRFDNGYVLHGVGYYRFKNGELRSRKQKKS